MRHFPNDFGKRFNRNLTRAAGCGLRASTDTDTANTTKTDEPCKLTQFQRDRQVHESVIGIIVAVFVAVSILITLNL